MKVSHARDGGQAAELEHAAMVLASRELLLNYPATYDRSCGELREWATKALSVLGTIADADRQAGGFVLMARAMAPTITEAEAGPR